MTICQANLTFHWLCIEYDDGYADDDGDDDGGVVDDDASVGVAMTKTVIMI